MLNLHFERKYHFVILKIGILACFLLFYMGLYSTDSLCLLNTIHITITNHFKTAF